MSKKVRFPQRFSGKTVSKILVLIVVASFFLEAAAFKNVESHQQKQEVTAYTNGVVMTTFTFISGATAAQARSQREFLVIKTQADKNPRLEYDGKYVIVQVHRSVRDIPLYRAYLIRDVISVRGEVKLVEKKEIDKIWERLLKGEKISEEEQDKMEIYDNIVTIIAKLGVINDLEQEPRRIFYLEASDIKVVEHIDRSVTET